MTETVDTDSREPAVRPQDDLFGHVNGRWWDNVEFEPDLPMAGGFVELALQSEAEVHEILDRAAADAAAGQVQPGSRRQQIGDLYASFLDEDTVERLGTSPLGPLLDDIAAVSSVPQLCEVLGRLALVGVDGAFAAYVNTDARRSDRYVVYLTQDGLGLPDESYYREDSFAQILEQYRAHVATMLRLLGDDEDAAGDAADRILLLETRLAAGHWDRVEVRDVVKAYTLVTADELRALVPSFDVTAWLRGLGAEESVLTEFVVRQPSYLTALSAALTEVELADWKDWLRFHLVSSLAAYLGSDAVEAGFDFYGRTLTGTPELKVRWKRGVALTNGLLGEAVGEAFVAEHFPPESKVAMETLVGNLLEAYRRDIEQLTWMGPDTKARALEKLQLFRSKIGYPSSWRDYSSVVIRRDDLLGNVLSARAFETRRQLAKLGEPVDREEWFMPPQTVNAYYNPGLNEICFPAAILRPPFFDIEADAAVNYGGIGAVIGHEIGHGFDDQGSRYDGEGNLAVWWTDDDRARFQALADALIAQYDGFEPRELPGRRVNGSLTVGENIGDLGGLQIALQAYMISVGDAPPPVVEGRSAERRLFESWALCWRIKMRDELAVQRLAVDPHSPPEFRANVVRNLDEFHQAYATAPGDGLWLDPEERVRIW